LRQICSVPVPVPVFETLMLKNDSTRIFYVNNTSGINISLSVLLVTLNWLYRRSGHSLYEDYISKLQEVRPQKCKGTGNYRYWTVLLRYELLNRTGSVTDTQYPVSCWHKSWARSLKWNTFKEPFSAASHPLQFSFLSSPTQGRPCKPQLSENMLAFHHPQVVTHGVWVLSKCNQKHWRVWWHRPGNTLEGIWKRLNSSINWGWGILFCHSAPIPL